MIKRVYTDDVGSPLKIKKSQGKGMLGFLGKRRRRKKKGKKETSGRKISLQASLYTQKGRENYEIPIMPLKKFTGYYILPSL